jgi:hypothetical protein
LLSARLAYARTALAFAGTAAGVAPTRARAAKLAVSDVATAAA